MYADDIIILNITDVFKCLRPFITMAYAAGSQVNANYMKLQDRTINTNYTKFRLQTCYCLKAQLKPRRAEIKFKVDV